MSASLAPLHLFQQSSQLLRQNPDVRLPQNAEMTSGNHIYLQTTTGPFIPYSVKTLLCCLCPEIDNLTRVDIGHIVSLSFDKDIPDIYCIVEAASDSIAMPRDK